MKANTSDLPASQSPLRSATALPSPSFSFHPMPLPLPSSSVPTLPPRSLPQTYRHKAWNGVSAEIVAYIAIQLSAADWSHCKQVSHPWFKLWSNQIQRFRETPRWNRLFPEIVAEIACYLEPSERSRCQLVSMSWHNFWVSHLWDKVALHNERSCNNFDRVSSTSAFNLRRSSIRSFSTCHGYEHGARLLEWTKEDTPNLHEIGLDFDRPVPGSSHVSTLDLVTKILQHYPRLLRLSLIGYMACLRSPDRAEMSDTRAESILFWIRSASLKSLQIECHWRDSDHHHQIWGRSLTDPVEHLPALQSFCVSNWKRGDDSLLLFLYRCPNLEKLEIHRSEPLLPGSVLNNFRQIVPKVTSVVLEIPGLTDDFLNTVLETGDRAWKNITLAPSGTIGRASQETLMCHAATIESLVVEGLSGLSSDWIKLFFQSSPNLKRFDGLTLSRPREHVFDLSIDVRQQSTETVSSTMSDGEEEDGDADDEDEEEGDAADEKEKEEGGESTKKENPPSMTITTDWACQGLQYLALTFSGLPRPDIGGGDLAPVIQWRKSDLEQGPQRHVYAQLGALTDLRELVVGHGTQSQRSTIVRMTHANTQLPLQSQERVQCWCLSFSLASGLHHLSSLKKLVLLDVSNCAHKIGLLEIKWMHLNWPLLKTIIGLLERVGICIPDPVRDEELKKVRAWLMIHDRGIGYWYYTLPGCVLRIE